MLLTLGKERSNSKPGDRRCSRRILWVSEVWDSRNQTRKLVRHFVTNVISKPKKYSTEIETIVVNTPYRDMYNHGCSTPIRPRQLLDMEVSNLKGCACAWKQLANIGIARYLQERGYGNSAVQLGRDWGLNPQELPFAPAVKTHTLISILQHGLAYDELLASVHTNHVTPPQSSAERFPVIGKGKRYTFIDERKRRASTQLDEHVEVENVRSGPRKRARTKANGVPPMLNMQSMSRRQSKTSILEPEANGNSMDFDQPDISPVHELPSHTADEEAEVEVKMDVEEPVPEPEPIPIVSTLETGQSIGVQSEKLVEERLAHTVADMVLPGVDIMHTSWSPHEPNVLLATGGSLWGSWRVRVPTNNPETNEPDNKPVLDSGDFTNHGSDCKKYFITASTWVASGDVVIAVEGGDDGGGSRLHLLRHTTDVSLITRISSTVVCLRWNWRPHALLSVSLSHGRSSITVWDVVNDRRVGTTTTSKPVLDAAWAGHDENNIIICGEHFLDVHHISESSCILRHIATDVVWEKIKYDFSSNKLACLSPEDGLIGLLDLYEYGLFKTEAAHEGEITAMEWQPIDDTIYPDKLTWRFLATSSTDGTIKLWRALETLQCTATFHMGSSTPVMALAFSVNGGLIAAAGDRKIAVWKVEAEGDGKPKAIWYPAEHREHLEYHVNGDGDGDGNVNGNMEIEDEDIEGPEAPFHSLSWNLNGTMVAYGQGKRITVIDVR